MKVKWGKELYSDVDLNTDDEPVLFKAQLQSLTGVQPHRQKIMIKGAVIKVSFKNSVQKLVKHELISRNIVCFIFNFIYDVDEILIFIEENIYKNFLKFIYIQFIPLDFKMYI